ncbi:autophagy protein apg9 protein [Cardiosporidium cionae]|uniref:Autophagy-related protein 9 n=1 Tax=Cardiosporidium cionae TaxID=476202 RepID=A0ABQ7JBP8_9APIC|nr:autophagy protein apg9 protein [Cardiosporidium cionae]|eukprot:KAF8821436.1 autophagy protein apg9 protein [Cardiosporidium cionae]
MIPGKTCLLILVLKVQKMHRCCIFSLIRQMKNLHYLSPFKLYERFMYFVQYTHYFPASWRRLSSCMEIKLHPHEKNYDFSMQNEFHYLHELVGSEICRKFFSIRFNSLLGELLGVLVAPIILLFYLPSAANDICDIISRGTSEGATGDFCVFGNLDISQNGNPLYNAPLCSSFNASPADICSGFLDQPGSKLQTINGKLEKSLLSFLLYYRLPPIDDTSPVWDIFGMDELMYALEDSTQSNRPNGISDDMEGHVHENHYNTTCGFFWQRWGYSQAAIDFLHRLEIFQKEQLDEKPFLCCFLPSELRISLSSLNYSGDELSCLKLTGPPPLNEKATKRFYEVKTGRQFNPTSHLNRLFAFKAAERVYAVLSNGTDPFVCAFL